MASGQFGSFSGRSARSFSSARAYPRTRPPYSAERRVKNRQPTSPISLCSDREKTEVEFVTAGMDNKLFVSRYLAALPSAEQLLGFVERDREWIEMQTRRGR
jgi:hypothetical protein